MLKKTITYEDFNGNERTEDFYFNLTKSEIAEMELGVNGGMNELLGRVIQKQDGAVIMKVFKDILLKAYGEKTLDGKRFEKSEELSIAFSQTNAYDQLFMELVTDAKAAAAFVTGIMPADMQKEIRKQDIPALTPIQTGE